MPKDKEPAATETTEETTEDEPKLTPLQRVKQQQALMRKNRNIGAQRPDAEGGAAGGGGAGHSRVNLNRRSGGS